MFDAFEIRVTRPELTTKRAMDAAMKIAWKKVGKWHHAEATPKRFTQKHARKAGYKPRSKQYQIRKGKIQGHNNPLQFTGKLRRSTEFATIRATSSKVRIGYSSPLRVFNLHGGRLRKEFTTVLESEAQEVAAIQERTVSAELQRNVQVTTERIRG